MEVTYGFRPYLLRSGSRKGEVWQKTFVQKDQVWATPNPPDMSLSLVVGFRLTPYSTFLRLRVVAEPASRSMYQMEFCNHRGLTIYRTANQNGRVGERCHNLDK